VLDVLERLAESDEKLLCELSALAALDFSKLVTPCHCFFGAAVQERPGSPMEIMLTTENTPGASCRAVFFARSIDLSMASPRCAS
jgi:hypothetical protein